MNGDIPSDDDSDSSTSDILDQRNEEGWEDVEDDTEVMTVVSLFSDQTFPSAKAMLFDCKEKHEFDIWKLRKDFSLEFLDLIKLVNYIRSQVKSGNVRPDISTKDIFDDDKYLQPVLEDDALLYSLDDIFDSDSPLDTATSEVDQLREQLAQLTSQFQSYREEVQRSLLQDLDAVPAPQPTPRTSNGASGETSATSSSRKPPTMSAVDEGYFDSYSYNSIHELMLKDTIRTDTYRDFIYDNKHLFAGKTVLDVGCGTGILSLFCAKAGAKRVIAVDNSDVIHKARENVFRNGLDSVITCVRGKIEEVVLPVQQVDIIVSEWMGYCLLYETMLDSVLYARDKYLNPTTGLMIPSHAVIKMAPLGDSELRSSHIDFWRDVYGFDMTAMLEKAHEEVLIRTMQAQELGGEAATILELDLHTATVADLSFTAPFKLTWNPAAAIKTTTKISTSDIDAQTSTESSNSPSAITAVEPYRKNPNTHTHLEGFVMWFDTPFSNKPSSSNTSTQDQTVTTSPPPKRTAQPVNRNWLNLSTSPHTSPTHWHQGVLLIEAPKQKTSTKDNEKDAAAANSLQAMQKGDTITGTVEYRKKKDADSRGLDIEVRWATDGSVKGKEQAGRSGSGRQVWSLE